MKYLFLLIFSSLSLQSFSQFAYNDYSSKEKETIFFDDFLNNNNGWWVDNNDQALGSIEGGNYVLE